MVWDTSECEHFKLLTSLIINLMLEVFYDDCFVLRTSFLHIFLYLQLKTVEDLVRSSTARKKMGA